MTTEALLDEIGNEENTRDDVAISYAIAIRHRVLGETNWRQVNTAIVERWSLSALEYIKREAWKQVPQTETTP